MMRFLIIFLFLFSFCAIAQKVTLNPTIIPATFRPTDAITVTYDVTGTPLADLTSVYIWVWIPGKESTLVPKYNKNPASSNPSLTDHAKFTKQVNGNTTKFIITFTPQNFFDAPICLETKLGMLIKGNDWSDGQSTDANPIPSMTPLSTCFVAQLTSPVIDPLFVNPGSVISINATSSETATFTFSVDGLPVDQQTSVKAYSYTYALQQTSGIYPATLRVTNTQNDTTIAFKYIVNSPSDNQTRPAGVKPGINYNEVDPTTVTLCFFAPLKEAVYLLGEFNDFVISTNYKMNRDGEYFWMTLTGLTPGKEYAYQYVVDGVFLADPYADKILDPEDISIPAENYPNLKAYPQAAMRNDWYNNRVAVFQTGQAPYKWQTTDFVKPAKEDLVIYELLLRDYFDDGNKNYQSLIDTLTYLKRLGINAIELMPVMEFNGNSSWGYNPTFMFAPDKYYGTSDKLKELVDKCHAKGIAVILDIALNHQDIPNPYAMMYFDFATMRPTAKNPFFNVVAKHPFNVFYDLNHESTYTQAYVDTINYYWLHEFKVDGFRYDLSKGFTQYNSSDNVELWTNYDASRVAILKRMADKIWSHTPDAYIILEHFGMDTEEKELAEYRVGEGKGMMLWGKMTDEFNQNTMGYASNLSSDISRTFYRTRGWTVPHLIGYMESHDEERLMYKNLRYGNSTADYNVKQLNTSLSRMKAGFALLFTVPGPKMIWEFGELGYDHSINRCENGNNNPPGADGGEGDCRLSIKPPGWNYLSEINRASLYNFVSDFLRLRKTYDVFNTSAVTLSGMTTLTKAITLKNEPYTATPTTADEMNLELVTNFDVSEKTILVAFPHTGTWYDYYSQTVLNVTSIPVEVILQPGRFAMYTDFQIDNGLVVTEVVDTSSDQIIIYPNPVKDLLSIQYSENILDASFFSIQGREVFPNRISDNTWAISGLKNGMYLVNVLTQTKRYRLKFIKN